MRKSKFSEKQIIEILKEIEDSAPVVETLREKGVARSVLGENALIMFTYNFKRLLNLIGIALFQKLCIAIKENDLSQIREEIPAYILMDGVNLAYFLEKFLFLQNISKKMRYLKI